MTQPPHYYAEPLGPSTDAWRQRRAERPGTLGSLSRSNDALEAAALDVATEFVAESGPVAPVYRSDFRRDRDRILYSATFARLSGVTQVITPSPTGRQTHTRLTHSLKVAQVARSIAEQLLADPDRATLIAAHGGANPDVAEAAALAHDLGHPPFGHIGEVVLDRFTRTNLGLPQGFEGNAQSFRIVSLLEVHDLDGAGLGLTAATLAAVLKYPWSRLKEGDSFPLANDGFDLPINELRKKKFCFYEDSSEASAGYILDSFKRAMSLVPRDSFGRPVQTVEAAIMDVADDITYALHDLDDFYRAGMIRKTQLVAVLNDWLVGERANGAADDTVGSAAPRAGAVLRKMASRLHRSYPTRFVQDDMRTAARAIIDALTALDDHFTGMRSEIVKVQSMVSVLLTTFLQRLEVAETPSWERPLVHLSSVDWHAVEILKTLTRHFVIDRPNLAAVQKGQEGLLLNLLNAMKDWLGSESASRVPPALTGFVQIAEAAGYNQSEANARGIVDFVASLSDLQAIELHRVLAGGHVDLAGGMLG